jgi:hypothetical protein
MPGGLRMKGVWTGWLVLALWAGGVLAAPDTPADAPALATNFQELDAGVEEILNEVVMLSVDMALLQETHALSSGNQLWVLVSLNANDSFRLERVQLQLDGRTVVSHQFNDAERQILALGGSHRLLVDGVPSSRHWLTATLFGRMPGEPDFQREASLVIVSDVERQMVELRIVTDKNQASPELSIKEWK